MNSPEYPFSAIVGQPRLKLALLLASVDWKLSVLLKGDKGSGKSTAARALAEVLPAGAPFVNLPIGATEDRLLGGLDLSHALEGRTQLKRGLIDEADGGVLYIDEVNLLPDHLTDALLDVASSGYHRVERDGLSASADAKFVLLGSMNLEEGALRPQLLDRFALSLDVTAPPAAEERAYIIATRLRFDANPIAFCTAMEGEQQRLREAILNARSLISTLRPPVEMLQRISQFVTEAGVRSLRADLAALRAAIAHATLNSRTEISCEDIEVVMPLVLHHRARPSSNRPPMQPPDGKQSSNEEPSGSAKGQTAVGERVFPVAMSVAPELRVQLADSIVRGRGAAVRDTSREQGSRSEVTLNGTSLDILASFTKSFRNSGAAALQVDNLVFRKAHQTSGVRYIFVLDASGSHAVKQRMSAVKGIAAALLQSSVDSKDEVAVISFRGAKAEIVLEPCRDADAAMCVLEFLPTGGRTPLAHALELASSLVNPASVIILLTDGRANVPLMNDDPWTDALTAATKLTCPSVIVCSAMDASDSAAMEALAAAMRGRLIHLDDLSKETVMRLLHE